MKKYAIAVLTLGLMALAASSAMAVSSYKTAFLTQYPAKSTSTLNSCTLCHAGSPSINNVNAYGNDYANAGYVYTAIEALDSDGDGSTNIAEINANTWPGDAASKPGAVADATKPTVSTFTIPATSASLTVSITSIVASDNVGVTGYLVNESATAPAAGAAGWSATPPANYTFATSGSKTLYAWAKDAAGNVSLSKSAAVVVNAVVAGTGDKIGVFRSTTFYLDSDGNGLVSPGIDKQIRWGMAGDIPVVGDWNGSGTAKIGVYRNGQFLLDYDGSETVNSVSDKSITWGLAGDIPVVGDWNGTGTTKIGVYRGNKFILDVDGNGAWTPGVDKVIPWGMAGDIPVVGDWNGSGTAKIGVYRNGQFLLDYDGSGTVNSVSDKSITWGLAGDIPVVGDWNGTGTTKIGVYRGNKFILDVDGNGAWTPGVDKVIPWGMAGDIPVVGNW